MTFLLLSSIALLYGGVPACRCGGCGRHCPTAMSISG